MKKTIIFSFLVYMSGLAQELDFSLASGKATSPALAYSKLYGKKFKAGYGLRLTSCFSKDANFITAPAHLTAGKESILAFLESQKIIENLDTLNFSYVNTNALNTVIYLQYSLSNKLDFGFNIDAFGYSFGKAQTADFKAKQSDAEGVNNNGKSFRAKPTAFNLLLISDSDIGNLNSELYLKYNFKNKISVRTGLSFQFVEYRADQKLAFSNDRFRAKVLLPMLAVSYKL